MKGSLRSHHLGVKGVGAVAVVVARDKSSPDTQVAAAQEVEEEGTLVVGVAAHSRVAVEAQTLEEVEVEALREQGGNSLLFFASSLGWFQVLEITSGTVISFAHAVSAAELYVRWKFENVAHK